MLVSKSSKIINVTIDYTGFGIEITNDNKKQLMIMTSTSTSTYIAKITINYKDIGIEIKQNKMEMDYSGFGILITNNSKQLTINFYGSSIGPSKVAHITITFNVFCIDLIEITLIIIPMVLALTSKRKNDEL